MIFGARIEGGVERQSPEQAFLKIMKYIGEDNVAMHSARFKAFTDLVDLQTAREPREGDDEYNRRDMMETIRKRKNGVPNYLFEYKRISSMIDEYKISMDAVPHYDENTRRSLVTSRLEELKIGEIFAKSWKVSSTHKR